MTQPGGGCDPRGERTTQMIGRLTGKLVHKQAPDLLLDINGVGYEVQAPMSTFYQLPAVGAAVSLHIHMVVREDAQLLYGFIEERDRQLFRTLIKVNGVGPKLALTILSGIEVSQFVTCVQNGDTASLVKLPGVGRKTAERLLVEMSDRLKDWAPQDLVANEAASATLPSLAGNQMLRDAQSALVALGYKPAEASRAVAAANSDGIGSSEELIRQALKTMVK
jgi:Holliday junction DNA helicase RuvA